MFEVNNKDINDTNKGDNNVFQVSLLLTLNIFHTIF